MAPKGLGEAKSRGWVGGWVVGRGSCLFEDKKKIYVSSLSARSKFVLGLFREFPVVDKKRVRVRDPRPTTHDPPTHAD